MRFSNAVCFLALFAVVAFGEKVSPVQKVVELLDNLKGKVKADLDVATTQAEQFAEFCDKEISDKGYAIKTAARQIESFMATMAECTGTISAKESEVSQLGTAISAKEKELADAASNYKQEKAVGDEAEKELIETIDELAGGIVQVKKGASLLQVKNKLKPVVDVLEKILDATSIDNLKRRKLNAFLQSQGDSEDLSLAQAQQHSATRDPTGIVDTLEDMKAKAENQLSANRKAAMETKYNYDMVKMSVEGEIRNQKAALGSATAQVASSGEELGKAKGELAEVEKSKALDEEYVSTTKMDCETKASEFQEDKADAEGEMAAIAKAKEILETGVKAFVQVSSRARLVDDDDMTAKRRERLVVALKGMGKKFRSFAFTQMASMASADPFAKIKGLVGQMIEKLMKEAEAEATHKAFCDEEQAKSQKSREVKTMKLDQHLARIDKATATVATLQESIKVLESELAEIDSAVSEASSLRAAENEQYLKASGDYKASAEAVAAAIQVLRSYYEGGSFIQVSSRTGSKSALRSKDAGSIISVLEMAESDFTKLLAEAETGEQSAATAFEKLSQESKLGKASKQAEIKGKESEIKSLTAQMENYKEDKASVSEELDAVISYINKLKPECEVKAMSYEEKVARREAEIEGLKEALSIIDGQAIPAALLQTSLRGVRRV